MPSRWKEPAVVTQFIRKVRGASQAILARASDGKLYVVKFRNNRQGPNLLFNECMGTELYLQAGLPVPSWRPMVLTSQFTDRNPGCWIETPNGHVRPEPGLCFGSRFLGGGDIRLFEILPGNSFRAFGTELTSGSHGSLTCARVMPTIGKRFSKRIRKAG